MFEQQMKCKICKKKLDDGYAFRLGNDYVCAGCIKDPGLSRKIYPTYDIVEQLIQIMNKKAIPEALLENKIKNLEADNSELLKANNTLKNEPVILKAKIEKLITENKHLIETTEADKKKIAELLKQRDLTTLEPVMLKLAEAVNGIDIDVRDGNTFAAEHIGNIKTEMAGLREEVEMLKSTIEVGNKEAGDRMNDEVDDIRNEIGALRNEMKQFIDTSQKNTLSEISKVNENISEQLESNQMRLVEMNKAIADSGNSFKFAALENQINELKTKTDSLGDKLLTQKVPEPAKIPEPAKEEPAKIPEPAKEPATPKKTIKQQLKPLKHEAAIIKALETPKSTAELKELGIPERSLYDTLKKLEERGQIRQESGKYLLV